MNDQVKYETEKFDLLRVCESPSAVVYVVRFWLSKTNSPFVEPLGCVPCIREGQRQTKSISIAKSFGKNTRKIVQIHF